MRFSLTASYKSIFSAITQTAFYIALKFHEHNNGKQLTAKYISTMDSITPEYLHIILNHLPLIGFLAAVIPLLIGAALKKVELVRTGVLLVLLFGAPAYFIIETGEEAADRLKDGEIGVVLDELSHGIMHEHEERAETAIIAIYITLGLAVLCLAATFKMKKAGMPLAWITLLSLVVSLGLTTWTAQAGGKIRHPEFRTEADIKAMQAHSEAEEEPHSHAESTPNP